MNALNSCTAVGAKALPDYNQFNVECFQVVCDTNQAIHIPVTPLFETIEQAREILSLAKEQAVDRPHVKNLRISRQVFFYYEEYEEGRLELLQQIIKA